MGRCRRGEGETFGGPRRSSAGAPPYMVLPRPSCIATPCIKNGRLRIALRIKTCHAVRQAIAESLYRSVSFALVILKISARFLRNQPLPPASA